jgi:tRNA(fMet)-specific endonuclease VapC
MIVLDTDHMSVLERHGTPASASLLSHLAELPLEEEVVTTIITYEEQMRGWMAYLARTRSGAFLLERRLKP